MRAIITGTVGLDKAPFLEQVCRLAQQQDCQINLCHVGARMYEEAPDVAPGRILDLPLARLHQLRRSVFKDILALAERSENLIVNTHATFRWKHGLFPAFDFDQLVQFNADMYICLIDNVDAVHSRLLRDHQLDHSLKDLLVWREEEILATEMMMMGCNLKRTAPMAKFYLVALGHNHNTATSMSRLLLHPEIPRVYLSFPMTHVSADKEIMDEIEHFRRSMTECFTVFDPADLEEHQLYLDALAASERGQKAMEVEILGNRLRLDVAEILQVSGDIHAQIYARDFQLIDQSDMIVSYIPELPDGKPALSSGVERELQHAYEATREVYVIWRPQVTPSPFITETATRLFSTTKEALRYFKEKNYIN